MKRSDLFKKSISDLSFCKQTNYLARTWAGFCFLCQRLWRQYHEFNQQNAIWIVNHSCLCKHLNFRVNERENHSDKIHSYRKRERGREKEHSFSLAMFHIKQEAFLQETSFFYLIIYLTLRSSMFIRCGCIQNA